MKKAKLTTVQGQPSFKISTNTVEAFVTQLGGHLGPVTFKIGTKKIQPYSVAPWATESTDKSLNPIIKVLRGDFFCMPFGGNDKSYKGEKHPIHGETANEKWTFESLKTQGPATEMTLKLKTKIRKSTVTKSITLIKNHAAVYCKHTISGMTGPMSFGHHAMLKFPEKEGSGIISTSRFLRGQIFPGTFENPANYGYSSLKPGGMFSSLDNVPMADGSIADLTGYPARKGFEDLVILSADPADEFAWTAITFPAEGYLWFSIKNPRVLASTVLWMSNGGRHYAPWNGRHTGVMGLEEVTAYFHYGLTESAGVNQLNRRSIPTCVEMTPDNPYTVNYIMGVSQVPRGFNGVRSIKSSPEKNELAITADNGMTIKVPVFVWFVTGT